MYLDEIAIPAPETPSALDDMLRDLIDIDRTLFGFLSWATAPATAPTTKKG